MAVWATTSSRVTVRPPACSSWPTMPGVTSRRRPARRLPALAWAARRPAAEPPGEQGEFCEKKIRPVLVEQCYKCHSGKSDKVRGGLVLDTRDGLLKGGESGPAVVPGKPDDSLLFKAIRYEDHAMPPKSRLPEAVIADFQTWIQR